jgi:hypothetical protein
MPGFDDIFGNDDDFLDDENENDEKTDEWNTGDGWDTGEKENIWRAAPPANPNDVWASSGGCDGGCDGCDDDSQSHEATPPDFGEIAGEPMIGGKDTCLPDVSEYDEMEECDELMSDSEEEEETGSPSGLFDDIFG